MATQAHPFALAQVERRPARIPERLARQWRTMLISGDIAVVLFVSLVVLNGDGNKIAGAILTAGIICGIFWYCGFYKRSYAVTPHDELYYACAGVSFAAIPVALILAMIGSFTVISIALALIFCAVGTSALRVRLHLERRIGPPPYAGIDSITPGAWHDRESAGFRLSKRIFDVVIALIAAIVLSPFMLLATIAITIESGAPVLFRQERIGENGRPFWILKFRTMKSGAGAEWAKPGDSRITRVGALLRRTSLDELPQLINVLRGDMSIVGPRPEMVTYAASFAHSINNYEQRHVVAPGITGWAQLYLKRNLEPSDMPAVLPYDLFYVEHSSVLFDFALILKTGAEVVFHRAV